jgi:chitosanase
MSGAKITSAQEETILRILEAIETGRPGGDYGLVSLMHDGEGDRLQVTLGIQFDEASGDLKKVLGLYQSRSGPGAVFLAPHIQRINTFATRAATVLGLDESFHELLRGLGSDPIMQKAQDDVFEQETWAPAKAWADQNGFTLPLSLLVIADSFLQSGSMLSFLRNRFVERVPARGGLEKSWIRAYVTVRHSWLRMSPNAALRSSSYRTRLYLSLLELQDWAVAERQYVVNGVEVKGAAIS